MSSSDGETEDSLFTVSQDAWRLISRRLETHEDIAAVLGQLQHMNLRRRLEAEQSREEEEEGPDTLEYVV